MFNNFITAGCSFTAGNSVIEEVTRSPSVWPDFLVSRIDAKVFYNIGITGGGNCAMCDSLIYLLETKKHINPTNTLIGINITGLDRIDTMCAVGHPNDTNRFPWKHDFGFSWINEGGFTSQIPPFNGDLQKHIGLEQIHLLNALAVTKCLTYLESHKFSYFFMVMDDQVIQDSPPWFLDFLKQAQFGFLLVSHDRYFLDNLSELVYALDRGQGILHKGNYSGFLDFQEEVYARQDEAYQTQQKEIKQKKRTIERFRAKATKSKMAKSMEKALGKIELVEPVVRAPKDIKVNFGEISLVVIK